jgi:AcrR family transcriptional regulator
MSWLWQPVQTTPSEEGTDARCRPGWPSDPREQLFGAAERVLLRDGPNGLTSRAVTAEAGCAKGVLHRHFADVDTLALTLIGTAHMVFAGRESAPPEPGAVEKFVTSVIAGVVR